MVVVDRGFAIGSLSSTKFTLFICMTCCNGFEFVNKPFYEHEAGPQKGWYDSGTRKGCERVVFL